MGELRPPTRFLDPSPRRYDGLPERPDRALVDMAIFPPMSTITDRQGRPVEDWQLYARDELPDGRVAVFYRPLPDEETR